MADRISLSTVWEESARFFRAEFGLLAPVAAIGFGVPMMIMLFVVPVDQAESGRLMPGPWMGWMIPCGLLSMMASLTISGLALRPGASVRDCLVAAFGRVPAGLALFMLNVGFQVALTIPVTLIASAETATRGGPAAFTMLARIAALAATIWLFVRVLPVWALLAERTVGPWEALRAVFAATRGRYRPLLLVRVIGAVAGMIVMVVTIVPLSAISAAIGKATGAKDVGELLAFLACSAVFAAVAALWTVFVARLYRRLNSGI